MKFNTFLLLLLSIVVGNSLFANMPPPQYEPITNYYFGNIDSLLDYTFYVKNSSTNKTYKIKQNASYEVQPKKENGTANKLEVWAINKTTNLQSNIITLYVQESNKPLAENKAHYAVVFSFDKNKALKADLTMVTPKCYSKKNKKNNIIPLVISLNKPNSNNLFPILSFISILFLTLIYFANKRQLGNQYV